MRALIFYLLGVVTTPVVVVLWALWGERPWKKRKTDSESYYRVIWD